MTLPDYRSTVAARLGLTLHVSPFRIRLLSVADKWPSADAECLEDWLLDVANGRGARIVVRNHAPEWTFRAPPPQEFPDEELVIAICQLQGADRPQLLRLASQLISRGRMNVEAIRRLAVRERIGPILKALSRAALRVDPAHASWRFLAEAFKSSSDVHDTVIHWTRLAEPVMANGRCNAASWRLVA